MDKNFVSAFVGVAGNARCYGGMGDRGWEDRGLAIDCLQLLASLAFVCIVM